MKLRLLRSSTQVTGKRVLFRMDGNVPIVRGRVDDGPHGRIARAAVDIEWLAQRGARVIILTHLGRPHGKHISAYSVKPVARRLSDLIGQKVSVTRDVVGPSVTKAVSALNDGEILMLENLRFAPREEANAPSFAAALAALGDLYVNDAFGDCHRAHASVDAITTELPSFAGPLVESEVRVLTTVIEKPKRPFVLIMGGLKIETKVPVLEQLLPKVDMVLIGGAIASAFLDAQGHSVGVSVIDDAARKIAQKILKKAGGKLCLPTDVIVSTSMRRDARMRTTLVDAVTKRERILDIGPKTLARYISEIKRARTIVWNGPLGYCELERFCHGTFSVARAVAQRTGKAITVVGGGDTVPTIAHTDAKDPYTLLSTGGGAMLAFLSGEPLPGLIALRDN